MVPWEGCSGASPAVDPRGLLTVCVEVIRANSGGRYGRRSIEAKGEAGYTPVSFVDRANRTDAPRSGTGGVRRESC